jgi:hypothetical protein
MGVRREKVALSSGCKSHPAAAPAGSKRKLLVRHQFLFPEQRAENPQQGRIAPRQLRRAAARAQWSLQPNPDFIYSAVLDRINAMATLPSVTIENLICRDADPAPVALCLWGPTPGSSL